MRASLDRWAVDACPHHGPGLTPATGYHAVWFGERAGTLAVPRYGRLAADGSPPGRRAALCRTDGAEHADLISAGAKLAIVWRSYDGQTRLRRPGCRRDGDRSFVLQELDSSSDDKATTCASSGIGERLLRCGTPRKASMSTLSFPKLAAAAALLALAAGWQATDGPPRHRAVRRRHCQPALQASLTKPALVVFSSTSCGNCPAVMQQLSAELRRRRIDATLVAVVTDMARRDDVHLLRRAHYCVAERLFAFDGRPRRCAMPSTPAGAAPRPMSDCWCPARSVLVTGAPSSAEFRCLGRGRR